ncbi:MAG: 3-phosphoshikimate 1-carboxyvinyltransferase [Ferruginibacter sp.]
MIATIDPSMINGNIHVPASKSAMQRACALALLNNGETIIHDPGNSNDDLAAVNIIKELGASVTTGTGKLIINSSGEIKANNMINCAESGLSFRMFAPITALSNSTVLINGSGSLLRRPMHFMDEVFPSLNVKTESQNGFLPIKITGPLVPGNIFIDGSKSSQYLTGLLFAFAKAAQEPVCIKVNDLKSKPYIDLSLQILAHFGYDVSHHAYRDFYIKPVDQKEKNIVYYTETDWSSASFLLVAGAIAGYILLQGLDIHSVQADKAIVDVLQQCNANIIVEENSISVKSGNALKAFEFDATDSPDLFPPLVVLAAYCNGTSIIKGVSRLAGKESNRGETLKDVFSKMGVTIILENDKMYIKGGSSINGAMVSSHHDHRIAMACAIAGLGAKGKVVIHDAEATGKSYPAFYHHLKMLGALVSLSEP